MKLLNSASCEIKSAIVTNLVVKTINYLPAFANRAQGDWITHHCHQTLCSGDGSGEKLRIGKKAKVKAFIPCLARVPGANSGQNDDTELFP